MNKGILILLLIVIILAPGCLSEKEYTGDELIDIVLADPGVAEIFDGHEYAIIDYGPAVLNEQDVYYVKISVDKGGKLPIPYLVFISKTGQVIHISEQFPVIDPATIEH